MTSKRILFVTPYPKDTAPSQRLRFEAFYPYFEKEGFEVCHSSFISKKFWTIIYTKGNFAKKAYYTILGYFKRSKLLFTIRNYDLIFIHLWVTPFGPPIFEWLYTRIARNSIYDIDDFLHVGDTSRFNNLVSVLKSKKKAIFLLEKSDAVIVSTTANYQKAITLNRFVEKIPVCIDTSKYSIENQTKKNHITVGWTGSKSTSKYLNSLSSVLKKITEKYDVEVLIIGDENFQETAYEYKCIPWNSDTEVADLSKIEIGLYPLPAEEWVLGKGGGKALQYMSLQIPVLATAIGENFEIIDNEKDGFLIPIGDEKAWIDKLELLINNSSLRCQMGLEGRKKVEQYYSLSANYKSYISIFNKFIASRST